MKQDYQALARKYLDIDINGLKQIKKQLDEQFNKAVELFLNTKGKIVITGIGKSGIVARKIAATLASTGSPALFLHPSEGGHGDLGLVSRGDVVVLLSNSGNTQELLDLLPSLKKIEVTIVALLGSPQSRLGQLADIVLNTHVTREACPLNLTPTTSAIAQLALGDTISAVLMERRHFTEAHFALYHPYGDIGRRLLRKVAECMHAGKALPLVSPTTPIGMVVEEINAKALGAVCVAEDNQLIGLITDGDIRRALVHRESFFNLKAEDVMTHSPVVIEESRNLNDALKLMENRPSQIAVLPVVDSAGTLIGLIRLHDVFQNNFSSED